VKNWKTSASGLVGAAAVFVASNPSLFSRWPWAVPLAGFVVAGGFACLGLAAKDSTTHSTVAEVESSTVRDHVDSGAPKTQVPLG
jgi:hypothetical protein